MKSYWVAEGSVRGRCPHKHRTEETAQACAERDQKACRALPGGKCYSDRRPVMVEDEQ
jgi:hypothetical protein